MLTPAHILALQFAIGEAAGNRGALTGSAPEVLDEFDALIRAAQEALDILKAGD